MATAAAAAAVMKLNLSSDQTDDGGGEPSLYLSPVLRIKGQCCEKASLMIAK